MVELADHRGRLNGDIIDPRILQQVDGVIETALSLGLAQHGFTQQVEIELEAPVAVVIQHPVQGFGFRVEHQVTDSGAQVGTRNGHHDIRQ